MALRRSKIFYIENKDAFFSTLRPDKKIKTAVSDLCISAVDWFDGEFDRLYGKDVIKIFASRENTVIRQEFEDISDTRIYFSLKTLNTFLCLFFSKKNKAIKDYYVEHTIEDLKSFFKQIQIEKPKNKKYIQQYNEFIELVYPLIIDKFKGYNFKLNNLWKWEFINEEQHIPVNNNSNNTPYSSESDSAKLIAEEQQDCYFKRLTKEFNQIRLSVVGFEMSIEHFIKIPLLKYNSSLKKQLESFKKLKENLYKSYDKNEYEIDAISKKIRKIERILKKEHDILDIIGFGNDVFIEAPAGNGKSTLLRWLTYQFITRNKDYLPVFIELMYNTSNNLVTMIEDKLSDYGLNSDIYKDKKLLLLLDGYDQFTGDKTKLFKDVHQLRRKYSVQIVFSGRSVPDTTKHGLELVLYNLKELEDNDIKKIFLAYLGTNKGQLYYDYISTRDLTTHLTKPLYLVFLLSHIRKKIDEGILDTSYIVSSIINKGKLLQSLIVERFIKKYEKDDAIDKLEWEEQKTVQIELLSYLAHQMTYEFENIEIIKKSIAQDILEEQCRLEKKYSKLEPSEIIKSFLEHNILHIRNGLLSFDKKELRLFFTALYLKDFIKSYAVFSKKKQHLFKQIGENTSTWQSIERYIIGFIDADILFNSFKKINFHFPVIMNQKFIDQYKLALEFINQKNYPIKNNFINEAYLFELNKMFVYKIVNAKRDTTIDYYISWKPYLRNLIVGLKLFNNKKIPNSIEKELNRRYFKFVSAGTQRSHTVDYFILDLKKYDLKLSLNDILAVVEPIDKKLFENKRFFYENMLYRNSGFGLNVDDKIDLVYNYIFKRRTSKYTSFFNKKRTRINSFSTEVLEDYSNEFINYFFKENKTIQPFTFKRYLFYKKTHNKHRFDFDSKKINSENIPKIIDLLKPQLLKTEAGSDFFYDLIYLFHTSFDDTLRIPFLDFFNEVINSDTYNDKQKTIAFIYLFNGQREDDMRLLSSIIINPKNAKRQLLLDAIKAYYPKTYRREQMPYNDSYINFICNYLEFGDLSYKPAENIFHHIVYTNERLNKTAIGLLELNKNHDIAWSIICFLGHFKISESVSVLEQFLDGKDNNLRAYYSLYQIDPKFYYDYKDKVKSEYQKTMTFLNGLISGKYNSYEDYQMQKALFVGDNHTLKILEQLIKKEYVTKMMDSNTHYMGTIISGLKNKCRLLNLVQKNSSI